MCIVLTIIAGPYLGGQPHIRTMLASKVWSSNDAQDHAHALQNDIVIATTPKRAFSHCIHVASV